MRAQLKPYPAYKDSGVAWIGSIPERWSIPRLGSLLRERKETNEDSSVSDVLSVMRDVGVIPYADKGNVGNKKSEDITRYKIVRPDDIVVNSMNVIIGSVGRSRYTGCLSPVYYVLTRRSTDDSPRYLELYFQTKPFQKSLVRIGNGILAHRMRIPMELLKCEPFPHPPAEEQTAIVRFLDYMDRRIRRYIRAKQNLIKLLEEQKRAIIHQAVTGQIDVRTGKPYPAYKDSGVEWLGQVPEHWEVRRLKTICHLAYGDSLPAELRETGPYRVYGSNGPVGFHSISNTKAPCLVIGRKGSFGKVNFSNESVFAIDTTYFVDERHTSANLRWLYYLIGQLRLDEVSRDSAIPGLAREDAHRRKVPALSLHEQLDIARFLDGATANADGAIERVKSGIELVREYRARLIADVVTGKLDVREVAANLPEEPDEPGLLEDENLIADEAEGEELVAEEAALEEIEV